MGNLNDVREFNVAKIRIAAGHYQPKDWARDGLSSDDLIRSSRRVGQLVIEFQNFKLSCAICNPCLVAAELYDTNCPRAILVRFLDGL